TEHLECIKFTVDYTNHRVPVIAGTGSNDTRCAIELSVEAQKLGADGLLLVTPYYNKTTQAGLLNHFTIIANSVNIPIILYNIPGRTGLNISVETLEKLAHHKNIVAVKEASGNISYTAQVAAACGDLIDIYSGNDDMIVPVMSLGGKGVISVLSNIMPKETHEIAQLCLDNNFQKAGELQLKYLELINSLFCEVNPIPVKEAMNHLGMAAGTCRMPLTKMGADNVARLLSAMQNVGLPVSVVD
ncbi:MAG: 4-hydroxy-tetrahydrodipicolinate synthase, partial [Oscillospiraceae bacterium]|nr:4-hydroxy-tetrahydrodipicolinate synthase [Oscillospiraceae bacterium]